MFLLLYLIQSAFATRHNIILILADDLGYDDVPWHDTEVIAPHLMALSRRATVLDNLYVHSVCTPSRAALLTGRYPSRYGLQSGVITAPQPSCLPLDERTMAEELKTAGYATHLVGKWHLGHYCPQCMPTSRGFDSFYGYLTGAENYDNKTFCINIENDGPQRCGYDFRRGDEVEWAGRGTYSTYQFGAEAEKIITKSDETPFFMYLALQSVHGPLSVPSNYTDLYPDVHDQVRKTYLGMITAMDEAIGRIMSALTKVNKMEDTIIFFASDNGGFTDAGGRNYPLSGQKRTIYQGGIKSAGLLVGPNVPPQQYSNLMYVGDVQSTIFDMIQHKRHFTSKPLDGVSHWDALSGKKKKYRHPRSEMLVNIDRNYIRAYSPDPVNFEPYTNGFWNTSIQAGVVKIIDGITWKLLTGDPGCPLVDKQCPDTPLPNPFKSVRLFNLDIDPSEQLELSSQYPHVVSTLLRRIKHFDEYSVPYYYPDKETDADPAKHNGTWGPWRTHPYHWPT